MADDLEYLQEVVSEKHIGLTVIDSIAMAAGGDLNDAQAATRLFSAVRQLNTTTLLLAHTAKTGLGTTESSVFGSAFFTYLARSVWEIKATQEPGAAEIDVGLFHRKSNFRHEKPRGFHISHDTHSGTTIKKQDVATISDLAKHLSQPQQVCAVLRQGKLTAKSIAELTEIEHASLDVVLSRLRKRGELIQLGEYWALAAKQA
ncbi:MAG: hypothetical protein A2Z21_09365 [Candidatus Fraserbacteria bacterium RBG_16_55_9]|uniref:Uncharacterized protein n=1 Tax=Fraserbacteria sp. (strain RBG_16_55_9) TaxID=1817864 RepID=A0A1F5US21_FRAXR|nr:MAG: hypothetical protein A2Z21_09365 [Candidatus Fraserbacteria bacterium RBG_16_55_9]